LKNLLNYINNNCLKQNGTISPLFLKQLENNIQFKEQFYTLTKFLENNNHNKNITHHERYYCLINYILEIKKCPICKENELKFISFPLGYNKTCSKKCKYILSTQNVEKTNLEKYGTKSTLQVKEVQNKIEQTNLKLYGSKTYMGTKSFLEKTKEHNINKHGVEHFSKTEECKNKKELTNIEIYGFKNPMQNEDIKDKFKNTCLDIYGFEYPIQNEDIKNKFKNTCRNIYGVEHPMQNKDIKDKSKNTCIEKYGKNNASQQHILHYELLNDKYILNNFISPIQKNNNTIKNILDKKSALDFYNIKKVTLNRYLKKNISKFENITLNNFNMELEIKKELLNIFPKNYLIEEDIIINDRTILKGKELDLYIPKLNLAIEYNGLMFHSFGLNKYKMFNNFEKENIQKNKHLEKTIECEKKGIHLFHINENEWIDLKKKKIWINILKSYIENKLEININTKKLLNQNIYQIKELDYDTNMEEINIFLENNSLECFFNIKKNKYIGCYNYNNELISLLYGYYIIKDNNYIFNILEICNNFNKEIYYDLNSILTLFINHLKIKNINILKYNMNRRFHWNTIQILEKNGFIKNKHIYKPNYFYFFKNKINKLFSKEEIRTIYNDTFKKKAIYRTNEKDIYLYKLGYRKIYDSGNITYIL
jgi:hypothetical protein